MSATLVGREMDSRLVQDKKALSPMTVIESDSPVTEESALHLENKNGAKDPTTLVLKLTLTKLEQFEKAPVPIWVTLFGTTTETSDLHPPNE